MHNPLDVSLKLHMDPDGMVWYLEGQQLPVCSGKSLAEFMQDPLIQHSAVFHIIATPRNTALILETYFTRHHDDNFRLYLCTPMLCHTAAERDDPEVALVRARRFALPSSLGGWHQFTSQDYSSYMLAALESKDAVSDQASLLLESHPVWPALSFMPTDVSACCRLLAAIRDPRWYIDLDHPDRTVRLEAYMGLTMSNVRMAFASSSSPSQSKRFNPRCRLVIDCWHRGMENVIRDDPSLHAPGNFVYRVWSKHATKDPVKGQLRASQIFLRYLRHTWLDALYTGGDGLFVPEYFFKNPVEIDSFKKHMLSSKH